MPLEVKLAPKLTYKLRLTPQIKLALNLLQLPLAQLKEYLKQEIEKNPLLEPSEDNPTSSKEKLDETIRKMEEQEDKQYEFDTPQTEDEEKRQYQESLITQPASLQEHLLRQLQLLIDSKTDLEIGKYIIGNINENGYFTDSVEEVAKIFQIDISKVEEILCIIQTLDPVGIGARNLRECLLIQLKAKGEEDSLESQIVDRYLNYLEKKRFDYIAKKLKCSVERVKEALKEIANLEPKPGRAFSTERAVHLIPDAILRKNKDGYEVIPNQWELPRLSLNAKYKDMLKKKDAPQEVKEYLEERLKAGRSLIDAVNKRRETIRKIIEEIVHVQKDFLDNGATHFKPLTLSQIAKEIGKHKSTVSRAISNKYIHTPYGIFKLRDFINSGVKQGNGEFLSSKTIKAKIKNLIENENKGEPLSDQEIANHLKEEGLSIARRTITKYRKQLKILPSTLRRE